MSVKRGHCLVSQEIRGLVNNNILKVPEKNLRVYEEDIPSIKVKKGFFVDENLEGRVQPGSFEPSLGDELFVLDAEGWGLLRPSRNESIYRTLLQVPRRKRARKDITEGFEIKTGFTYLIKLREKFNGLGTVSSVRSSPKSSVGRLFPKTRFLVDYNPALDEVYLSHPNGMDMWLLVQPIAFNLIVSPELTLNQLRFFKGDARLTEGELIREFQKQPLLYEKEDNGNKTPLPLMDWMTSDGLQLNLDALGKGTHHVFGLRARKNPDPIDLSKKLTYESEAYFEPLIAGKETTIKRGEHYLLASNEIVFVPSHLHAELRRHSREGIEGRTHDAGFADPGFVGDMVYEVSPDEEVEVQLNHQMPLSKLDFFRTSQKPDKIYGQGIGSSYQDQVGPRVSKHFKKFDFETAQRNHEKLSRIVLVQDADLLKKFRNVNEGFEPIREEDSQKLLEVLRNGFFHSRYDCEDDPLVLQPIPYTIVFNDNKEVFSYVRTEDKAAYGDTRLLGKHSIGLGGHVSKSDGPEYLARCLEREVTEEEVKFQGERTQPRLVGTLFAKDKPVDRVHFGLIYTIYSKGNVISNEKSIAHAEFIPIQDLKIGHRGAETETWSRILIPHLPLIYQLAK